MNSTLLERFSFYKIINTSLRILPLGIKFIFFVALSKYLSVDDYADYTLITTTITISIFVFGLDFYNFSIRNILTDKHHVERKVINSFALYLMAYLIFFLFVIPFLSQVSFINKNGVFLISLICVTEHLNQEIYRLQIAFKKVFIANIIFFLRVFGWTGILLFEILWISKSITNTEIFQYWLGFNLVAIILNIIIYCKSWGFLKEVLKLDVNFIVRGFKVSSLFFLGTLSLKSI